ncbi:hypothetical protein GCM10009826_00120 [Humibacillus xanthopallidus]
MPLVIGDQRRVSLGGEVVGECEGVGGQGAHVISSDRGFLASAGDSASAQGSCRKPPTALYVGSGGGESADARSLLRLFPDYCADPVWNDTGMADLDQLEVAGWLRD